MQSDFRGPEIHTGSLRLTGSLHPSLHCGDVKHGKPELRKALLDEITNVEENKNPFSLAFDADEKKLNTLKPRDCWNTKTQLCSTVMTILVTHIL